MSLTLASILGYVALQLLIGFWVSRNLKTEQDYLLAGRRLGYGVSLFSLFATWFGAESCIGAAGAIYEEGLSASASDPFGYGLCLLLMGLLFARALYVRKLTTLADLFRERFSPTAERVAVLLMVPTSVLWAAAQVRAFGQVLALSSELELHVATTFAAVAVVAYTASGGLLADAITDVVQGVVLIAGLLAIGFVVLSNYGGLENTLSQVQSSRWSLAGDRSLLDILESWALPVCGSLFAQEMVARVLAARSPGVAARSAVAASALYVCVGLVPVFIGLLGPGLFPGLSDPEHLLPHAAKQLLPQLGYVLFAGALLSSILSTVDSALLVSASLVSHNIIGRIRPHATEAQKVRSARFWVVGFGLVAYVLALSSRGVHDLVQQASGFGSAGIFVITVVGLYTPAGKSASAVAALVTGVVAWVLGAYLLEVRLPYLASLGAAAFAYAVFARVGATQAVPDRI